MAIVATGCGFAAIGLARNREWGRRLAIGILIINLIGDSLDAFIHARRKDFDRFANWWTNDSFSRQDKSDWHDEAVAASNLSNRRIANAPLLRSRQSVETCRAV